jgi:hypothetical protein
MDALQAQLEPLILKTLGTVFVGYVAACVIYGILVTQVFQYFRGYPFDKARFKYAVSWLGILKLSSYFC